MVLRAQLPPAGSSVPVIVNPAELPPPPNLAALKVPAWPDLLFTFVPSL